MNKEEYLQRVKKKEERLKKMSPEELEEFNQKSERHFRKATQEATGRFPKKKRDEPEY